MYGKNFRESMTVPTGLVGVKANEVLNAVIGQMSDGKWENTPGYEKYWEYCEIDDNNNIIVEKGGWESGFRGMDEEKVRAFFCRKINAVVKDFLEYLRTDVYFSERYSVDNCCFLNYHETISVEEIKQMVKQMKNYGKTPVKTVSEVAPAKTVKRDTLDYWM